MIAKVLDCLATHIDGLLESIRRRAQRHKMRSYMHIHPFASIGPNVLFIGPPHSFIVDEFTYINDAILCAGMTGRIRIGRRCAIGYRVSIKAVTHDPFAPCSDENNFINTLEKDITIGDYCWIGDNVFVREGVTLGNNVIVGCNSVVTKSFPDDVVIAGVPAVVIRSRKRGVLTP